MECQKWPLMRLGRTNDATAPSSLTPRTSSAQARLTSCRGSIAANFSWIGAVLAELVNPVVVGLTQSQRQPRVHAIAGNDAEPHSRKQDRDVDPFQLHAHDLRHRVVFPLDREIKPPAVGHAGAGQGLRDGGFLGAAGPFSMLLQFDVADRRFVVDDDDSRLRSTVGAHGKHHPIAKLAIQIAIEQVRGFHDVHIAVDESKHVFRGRILSLTKSSRAPRQGVSMAPAWARQSPALILTPDVQAATLEPGERSANQGTRVRALSMADGLPEIPRMAPPSCRQW